GWRRSPVRGIAVQRRVLESHSAHSPGRGNAGWQLGWLVSLVVQRGRGGGRLFYVDGNVTGVTGNPGELRDAGRADVAAAAAVAAVVLGVAFADRLAGHGPAIGPVAGVPRYYLTLDRPWSGHVARAVVHGSATGAALATARIPLLGGESPSVTGAADGRTFIIVDNTFEAPGHGYGVRFYRLRVGPDGRAVRLDPLRIQVWPSAGDDGALPPEGSGLAPGEQSQSTQPQVRPRPPGPPRPGRPRPRGAPGHLPGAAGGHQGGFLGERGVHSPPQAQ